LEGNCSNKYNEIKINEIINAINCDVAIFVTLGGSIKTNMLGGNRPLSWLIQQTSYVI
jgi:hypothetical protein